MSNVDRPRRVNTIYYFIPPLLFLCCLALSIGLTFAPCYSSMCVERFFPHQTRYHIALFYSLLAGIGVFLLVRALSPRVQRLSELYICQKPLPFTDQRLSVGAVLLFVWIAAATFSSIAYWLPAERRFWYARGSLANWIPFIFRVVWSGVTGHWVDIWIGLVILPVGRNSFLAHILRLQTSTLLLAHKMLAYALVAGSLIHGLIYYSFLAAWVAAAGNQEVFAAFNPDNPTLTAQQARDRGIYSWFCLPTGAVTGIVLIPVMAITSLPPLRRRNYNVFYFTHVALAVLVMVLVCLHASTNFYFTLPGLILWIHDWVWRYRNALGSAVQVKVENADSGWYRVCLPSDKAMSSEKVGADMSGKVEAGVWSADPLQTYYINIGQVSRIEAHPFTAALTETATSPAVLLFRKGPERKKASARDKEWTWKLGALADNASSEKSITLQARIEGPYTSLSDRLYDADHVLAIVGGTGITGAIAIANWWCARSDNERAAGKSLRLVWTVRQRDFTQVREVQELQARMKQCSNATFHLHVSSEAGRLSVEEQFAIFFDASRDMHGQAWVYMSGPSGLLASVESACVDKRRELRKLGRQSRISSLEYYSASFST